MTDVVAPGPAATAKEIARRFPRGFTWGVASSAYQIEGATGADGRGPSIWEDFARQPGRVAGGETGDVACDHYHRWREDLDLMAGIGVGAYRFSVSWPRVLPAGAGAVNQAGLDFYDRLVDGLLERGIRPVLTLYHWDLPLALQERGGWANPGMAGWFGRYAEVVATRLGDRVRDWITVNEPQVFAFTGHATGRHAPGLRDWSLALRVAEAALAAHGAAAARIRSASAAARIGVALNLNLVESATAGEADVLAAERYRAIHQGWFLDPLFGAAYPAEAVAAHREAGHLSGWEAAAPRLEEPDFLGINYYTREVVAADADAPFGIRAQQDHQVARTSMGWEVHPDGLRRVLLDVARRYRPRSLIVTENGAAFPDPPASDGTIPDAARLSFLAGHVDAVAAALEEGAPVEGYFVWSLLDNFEWEKGYGQRFGIVAVDYPSQRRTLKQSGAWYRSLLAAHPAD